MVLIILSPKYFFGYVFKSVSDSFLLTSFSSRAIPFAVVSTWLQLTMLNNLSRKLGKVGLISRFNYNVEYDVLRMFTYCLWKFSTHFQQSNVPVNT